MLFFSSMNRSTASKKKLSRFGLVAGSMVMLLCLLSLSAQAQSVKKVAITPLVVNAQTPMDYIREGVEDMLSSRLTWEDKVVVLNRPMVKQAVEKGKTPVDEARARELAKQLGADVVIWGSISVIGTSVSLDFSVLEPAAKQPPKKFFAQAKGMDEVILRVNEVSDQINAKVFGREETAVVSTTPAPVAKRPEPGPASAPAPGGTQASGKPPLNLKNFIINPLSPQIIMNAGGFDMAGLWRSSILPYALVDLAFADLDGDGKVETVIISKNSVHIYRYVGDKFQVVKEIKGDRWDNYISVDVGDIHGTGHPQIFITNYRNDGLKSLTYAWVQGDYKKIAHNVPYYLRINQLPMRGTVLLGQQTWGGKAFDDNIHILAWQKDRYVSVEKLKLPKGKGLTVFNFVMDDLAKNGMQEILYLNKDNRLTVLDDRNKVLYVSSEFYGGTVNLIDDFDQPNLYSSTIMDEQAARHYIPARLIVVDSVVMPGRKEIIVNRNKGAFANILSRFRSYTSGEVLSISWDGAMMKENWRTQIIPDYLANYGVSDFKNNGQKQLVVGIVQSRGFPFVDDARSVLYCYDLAALNPQNK
jgi:hypothetical protein